MTAIASMPAPPAGAPTAAPVPPATTAGAPDEGAVGATFAAVVSALLSELDVPSAGGSAAPIAPGSTGPEPAAETALDAVDGSTALLATLTAPAPAAPSSAPVPTASAGTSADEVVTVDEIHDPATAGTAVVGAPDPSTVPTAPASTPVRVPAAPSVDVPPGTPPAIPGHEVGAGTAAEGRPAAARLPHGADAAAGPPSADLPAETRPQQAAAPVPAAAVPSAAAPEPPSVPGVVAGPISPVASPDGVTAVAEAGRAAAPPLPEQLVTVVRPLRQAPDGTHRIALQLRPDELGEVQVEVRVQGTQISLQLRADQPATADLLRLHLAELRAELESAGFRAGSLDVGAQARDGSLTGREPRRPGASDPDAPPSSAPSVTLPQPARVVAGLDLRL